jgi:signal peptidase I
MVPAKPSAGLKRHLAAAALSTLLPGAGQLFLSKRRRAVILFLLLVAIASGFWPQRLPRSYPGVLLIGWSCAFLWLFAICDTLLCRDEKSPGQLSKWWVLAAFPLSVIGVNIFFTSLLFASGFRPMRVEASSMEPTIMLRERIFVDMHYYHEHQERRGDVVIVRRRLDLSADVLVVKRIIAIGGDTIEGKDQQVFLNGQILSEPFVRHKFPVRTDPELDAFGPVAVPNGRFFVMGDNRDISLDSRTPDFGLVDAKSIVGRALYAYHFRGQPLSQELN